MDVQCPNCSHDFEVNAEPVCERCYHPSSDHDDGWRSCLCGECPEFEEDPPLSPYQWEYRANG